MSTQGGGLPKVRRRMPHEPHVKTALGIETQTHTGALQVLAEAWSSLWRRCPDATPFQSPDWLIAWWRHFGQGGLWTMAFREPCGRLVAIVPLYIQRLDGIRILRFIGAGLSDYLDILCEPDWREHVKDLLFAELEAHPDRWDVAELQQLPASSATWSEVHRFSAETLSADSCPVLALHDASGRNDMPLGSERLRANLAADRRRLELMCPPVTIDTASPETANSFLDALRRLHGARWAARGKPGVLAADDVWAFQGDAFRGLYQRGVVRMYALHCAHTIAGVYYGFADRGRAWYYLAGFDPAFRRYGIGNQLVAHAIQEARREGARCFDFLRGQEPYKYRWGAHDEPTFSLRLYRNRSLRSGAPEVFQPRLKTAHPGAKSVASPHAHTGKLIP